MSLGRIYNEYYGRPDEMVNALIDTATCVLSSEYVKMTVKRAAMFKWERVSIGFASRREINATILTMISIDDPQGHIASNFSEYLKHKKEDVDFEPIEKYSMTEAFKRVAKEYGLDEIDFSISKKYTSYQSDSKTSVVLTYNFDLFFKTPT